MKKELKPMYDKIKIFKNREERKTALANNLKIARRVMGISQQKMLEVGGHNRVTIGQIENGDGDPRLSTIIDLATALGISPLLLLITKNELFSLADTYKNFNQEMDSIPKETAVAFEFANTKTKKGLEDVIQLAVDNFKPKGNGEMIGTAIGTDHQPGEGSQIGKALGKALEL